jgi:hypothetical protein
MVRIGPSASVCALRGCIPILIGFTSRNLQLNKGGGATPLLLRDLDCGVGNSIPTAPTKLRRTE